MTEIKPNTSLRLPPELKKKAQEKAEAKGYPSFSRLIVELLIKFAKGK